MSGYYGSNSTNRYPYKGIPMRDGLHYITEPKVGMGATLSVGSDAYPYDVIEVINHRRIKVRACDYKNTRQFPDQEWEITSNENGEEYELTLRKDGKWRTKGGNSRFVIGVRRAHQDPHF